MSDHSPSELITFCCCATLSAEFEADESGTSDGTSDVDSPLLTTLTVVNAESGPSSSIFTLTQAIQNLRIGSDPDRLNAYIVWNGTGGRRTTDLRTIDVWPQH